MNRHVAGLITFIVSTLLFVSLAIAAVMWSTTNISSVKGTLVYVNPANGIKVVREFTGSTMNFFEMHRDLAQERYFIHIHSENGSGLKIDADFIGGGLLKPDTTILLATWDDTLPAPILEFADGIFMDAQDVRALVLNGSYTATQANVASATATINAAGMLNYFGARIPARVTIQISPRRMPPFLSGYTTINRGLTVIPNNNIRPIAVDQTFNISFGNTTSIDLFRNAASFQTPSTLNATVAAAPLNGTLPAAGNYPSGKVTYRPRPGFSGTDVFDYYVRDVINLASDTKRVTVNVAPAPAVVPQDLPA